MSFADPTWKDAGEAFEENLELALRVLSYPKAEKVAKRQTISDVGERAFSDFWSRRQRNETGGSRTRRPPGKRPSDLWDERRVRRRNAGNGNALGL